MLALDGSVLCQRLGFRLASGFAYNPERPAVGGLALESDELLHAEGEGLERDALGHGDDGWMVKGEG